MGEELIVECKGLRKCFYNVVALDSVDFSVRRGEVHCIVGENGSGKSTLIKLLTGVYQPDSGEIYFSNQRVTHLSPALAKHMGIHTIYQELVVQPELSVAENILLGSEILKYRRFGIVDWKKMFERAQEVVDELGISINVHSRVGDLNSANTQTVQILKALNGNASIIIMDEPTAVYGKNEISKLHDIINRLKQRNISVIYISHHLDEVFKIGDRITVIRDGSIIAVHDSGETNINQLIKEMVGRDVDMYFSRERVPLKDTVFSAHNLSGNGVNNVSFDLKRGEILGIGGLVGSKRTELMELVFGSKRLKNGSMTYKGETYSPKSPRDAIRKGICMITENRQVTGLNLAGKIRENIVITNLNRLSGWPFINRVKERVTVNALSKRATIKCNSTEDLITTLSGGNQQKVVLSKWLFTDSMLYIFDEPTLGIDVGAKEEIYKIMVGLVKEGNTVIMISSDMLELLAMSDRIVVLHEGRKSGELNIDEITEENVLSLAIGGDKINERIP